MGGIGIEFEAKQEIKNVGVDILRGVGGDFSFEEGDALINKHIKKTKKNRGRK